MEGIKSRQFASKTTLFSTYTVPLNNLIGSHFKSEQLHQNLIPSITPKPAIPSPDISAGKISSEEQNH